MQGIERDYASWIERFDRIDAHRQDRIMEHIGRMELPPLISVLMPVYNPPPDHLVAAIRSVQDQLYVHWELCIADDASTDPAIASILEEVSSQEPRIRVVRQERNGHISAASNAALTLAAGAFVALLDHDDILPRHALYEVAATIVRHPDVDIIYSDEDHIDNEGRRSHPYFKPDWNAALKLGQNLISHLGVYRRHLMEKIGGFRIGFEGSQDHDLALRVVAETGPGQIIHIPKILYHWRQGAADQTFSEAAQARCILNGRRAIQDFVDDAEPVAHVEPAPRVAVWARVVYPIPEPPPLVSVIVAASDETISLLQCIKSLLSHTSYGPIEILLPSVGPSLPTALVTDPQVRLLDGQTLSANAMAAQARGDILLFLDPALGGRDPKWLAELVSHALRPEIGAVGAKLLTSQGTVLHAGVVLGGRNVAFTPFTGRQRHQVGYFGHLQLCRNVTAVSGGCLALRKRAFVDAGGFDDTLTPVFADIDLCLKVQGLGLRNLWTPYAELYRNDPTIQRKFTDLAAVRRAADRLLKRWGQQLISDRYWNPNLAVDRHEIALAFPPLDIASPTLRAA